MGILVLNFQKKLLYDIISDTISTIIFETKYFNKYHLHQIVKNNNKKIYKKYFVNQQLIKSNSYYKNLWKRQFIHC